MNTSAPIRAGAMLAALGVLGLCASGQVGTTARVSVNSTGDQGNIASFMPVVSADGRYVAFASHATNLVAGDTNGVSDVFRHDRVTGSTLRVSVSSSGAQGDGESREAAISADGRFIAFRSAATNLAPGDTNLVTDIFVRDLLAGTTELVSVSTAGQIGNLTSYTPSISADGRWIAFHSSATNLDPLDTNGVLDVFVRDVVLGTTRLVSRSSGGAAGDGDSLNASLSGDGAYVAFESTATNLVAGDTNAARDCFVRELRERSIWRVSVGTAGVEANGPSRVPVFSRSGSHVAFQSDASNLVAGDTNGVRDIFVHELAMQRTTLESVARTGGPSDGLSTWASLSADGLLVGFASDASNLVAGDANGFRDVFLRDRRSGLTELVSVATPGFQGLNNSNSPALSDNGHVIAFFSDAANLVSGDTNAFGDIFSRQGPEGSATVASYCTSALTSNGCVPTISATGTPSALAAEGFVIAADRIAGQRMGLILYGLSGSQAAPWGTGFSCVRPPRQRGPVLSSGGTSGACDGRLQLDWNTFVTKFVPVLGWPFDGTETVWAQAWFRDPQASLSSNFSDALWFTVCR